MDMHGELLIAQADPRPMYAQIVDQVRQLVAVGDWAPGREIPSIRELAIQLRVSVITVKRAYLELEREGVIVTRQGRGSFVAETSGLGPGLLEKDLQGHLGAAVELAAKLGLGVTELTHRLQRAWQDQKGDQG